MVETRQTTAFRRGDLVEAIGIAVPGKYNPLLRYGTVRLLDHGPAPRPFQVTVAQALSGDHDGDLVEIEADLLGWKGDRNAAWLGLKSGEQIFEAEVDQVFEKSASLALQEGSRLKLTGICLIEVGGEFNDNRSACVPRLGDTNISAHPADAAWGIGSVSENVRWWSGRSGGRKV